MDFYHPVKFTLAKHRFNLFELTGISKEDFTGRIIHENIYNESKSLAIKMRRLKRARTARIPSVFEAGIPEINESIARMKRRGVYTRVFLSDFSKMGRGFVWSNLYRPKSRTKWRETNRSETEAKPRLNGNELTTRGNVNAVT